MEVSKKQLWQTILISALVSIVSGVITAVIVDKIKAKNQTAQSKSVSQPAPKVTVTPTDSEVTTSQTTT